MDDFFVHDFDIGLNGPLCRKVLLTGSSGVGKTVLWHQLGRAFGENYEDEFVKHYRRNFKALAAIPPLFTLYYSEISAALAQPVDSALECTEQLHSLEKIQGFETRAT